MFCSVCVCVCVAAQTAAALQSDPEPLIRLHLMKASGV